MSVTREAPGVGRVGLLGHPALLRELGDGPRHRRLGAAIEGGELRDPQRAVLVEQGDETGTGGQLEVPSYGADQACGVHDQVAGELCFGHERHNASETCT
ncbi:MAG: hypothetical protein V9G12_06120 [Microthrixaceae bacterium]